MVEWKSNFGRRHIPLHNIRSLLPGVPSRQPGPFDGVPSTGNCQPRRGISLRVAPEGYRKTGEWLRPYRQREIILGHGEGHDDRHGEKGAARRASRGPADMSEAEVSCSDADKPGHEQNSVQQGLCNPPFTLYTFTGF
jgi:hypothetical protein